MIICYCIDVGSTTTKLISFLKEDKKIITIQKEDRVPTTVEYPQNDVSIAIEKLFKTNNIKKNIKDTFITSSAAGGLKVLIIALTSIFSGNSAIRVVETSGGVVLDMISVDSPRKITEKFERINRSQPDLILFMGGTEGGLISKIIELAYILKNTRQKNYITGEKIPLIYAGNSSAFKYIDEILSDDFKLHLLKNVLPNLAEENIEHVGDIIQEVFTDHVMKYAPGFEKLETFTANKIMPTPYAVEKFISYLQKRSEENILALDIGGATTDVFSLISGDLERTVVASLGMSYNVDKIISAENMDLVRAFISDISTIDDLYDYIGNKSINPQYKFENEKEKKYEMLLAAIALKKSANLHFKKTFYPHKKNIMNDSDLIKNIRNKKRYSLKDVGKVMLSGGIFTKLNIEETMEVVNIAFSNIRLDVYKDNNFVLPHLGNLITNSDYAIDDVLERYIEHCGFTDDQYLKEVMRTKKKKRADHAITRSEKKESIERSCNEKQLKKDHCFEHIIPFPYEIRVKRGNIIAPGQTIASFPRIMNEIFIKGIYVMQGESVEYCKRENEVFEPGEMIYRITFSNGKLMKNGLSFNYSGNIKYIDRENNIIIFERTIHNYIGDKIVKPPSPFKNFKKALKVRVGDHIYPNSVLCIEGENILKNEEETGIIKDIDIEKQQIFLKSITEKPDILSYYNGEILYGNRNIIRIKLLQNALPAMIGFGNTYFGKAVLLSELKDQSKKNIIIVDENIHFADIDNLMEKGDHFIFHDIPYSHFVKIKDLKRSAVVINNFNSNNICIPEYFNYIKNKNIYFHPITQIRAGTIRPFIVISS